MTEKFTVRKVEPETAERSRVLILDKAGDKIVVALSTLKHPLESKGFEGRIVVVDKNDKFSINKSSLDAMREAFGIL